MSNARVLAIAYLVMALLFAAWMDAMDRRYPLVQGKQPLPLIVNVMLGMVWPISMTMALGTMACCQTRWVLDQPAKKECSL